MPRHNSNGNKLFIKGKKDVTFNIATSSTPDAEEGFYNDFSFK